MQRIYNNRMTTVSLFKKEQMAMLRLLAFAEKDIKEGKTVSSADLRKGLRELVNNERKKG